MFTKTELAAFHRICDSLGTDLKKYQEWVDYDMKHYGKISDKTRAEIEKAGLEIIKSRYGDYEVISKDSVKDGGIILERLETYKGRGGEFTVLKVKRDNGRVQYLVTSDKRDIDAGDKMTGGTLENDLASAIKTAKEYASAPPRKNK